MEQGYIHTVCVRDLKLLLLKPEQLLLLLYLHAFRFYVIILVTVVIKT